MNQKPPSRTHLSLAKDSPEPRAVQPPELGRIVAIPQVGGLHHRYQRRAAAGISSLLRPPITTDSRVESCIPSSGAERLGEFTLSPARVPSHFTLHGVFERHKWADDQLPKFWRPQSVIIMACTSPASQQLQKCRRKRAPRPITTRSPCSAPPREGLPQCCASQRRLRSVTSRNQTIREARKDPSWEAPPNRMNVIQVWNQKC